MPSGFNPSQLAMNLINQNPNIASNPQAQELIQIIQSGDSARGEQMANNILNSYGISKEQGLADAKKFFGLPF